MTETKAVITLFGGSGDLAQRKLYPALFGLYQRGILADHFAVIGTARRPWSDEYYQNVVAESVTKDGQPSAKARAFASHFYYQSHDVTDEAHYITLKELASQLDEKYAVGGNRLFYMAMAPEFFNTIADHLHSEALLTDAGFNRLVIEKPFGHDYESAVALNQAITASFDERQIYRIDHYLGKEMIQALLGLRFGNGLLARVWNNQFIKDIQVTLSEAVGVEERAGYYETSGALRDMIQNHVMQIVGYLTMAQPTALTPEAVHEVRQRAFEQLHVLSPEEAKRDFVRGQYTQATIAGENITGYRDEAGVAPGSMTETFVAGKITTDDPALVGVPIYVRTGKRLTRKSTQITVTFKGLPHNLYGEAAEDDHLTVYVEPHLGVELSLNGKQLGLDTSLQQQVLRFEHDQEASANQPEAYERLLQNALEGDQTNFASWKELAPTWRFADAILAAWAKDDTMPTYPAGTMGPTEAAALLERDGHQWFWQPSRIQMAD